MRPCLTVLAVLAAALLLATGAPEALGRPPSREVRQTWRLRELRNFRDAGIALGLPAGRIFRSDDPRHRPFGACDRLRAAHIRTIVKLNANQRRYQRGRTPQWRRGACGLPTLEVSIPYERTEGAHGANIYALGRPRSQSAARRRVVSDMERHLGLMFREVSRLRPQGLPVLFQCSAGRDRTGVVLALLGLLAGARPAAVEADYLASGATVGKTSVVSLRRLLRRVGPWAEFLKRDLGLTEWELHKLRRLVRGTAPAGGAAALIAPPPPLPFGPP